MSLRIFHTASAPFEAARAVSALPEGHRARRLHGHGFLATVRCALPPDWAAHPGGEVERLRTRLASLVSRLDYRLLNDVLDTPTDENLGRWLRAGLDAPGIVQAGIHSTRHQGADLDDRGHAHVWRRYQFEAAHQLPHVPAGHKCGRMHGHGFEVILHADQDLGGRHLAVDYDHLDALWEPVLAELDHGCLNDVPGLENPTSEVLAGWIWARIAPALPSLSWVTVYETASCGASFDGADYRIWKEFSLDSAIRLQRAPAGSRLRHLHGHTYVLRLHLSAPLDTVMGWTVDFGDVKAAFDPLFRALDHQPLHEIAGLEDCDAATLAGWILGRAGGLLPALDRVDLYETRGCGAIACLGPEGPALPV